MHNGDQGRAGPEWPLVGRAPRALQSVDAIGSCSTPVACSRPVIHNRDIQSFWRTTARTDTVRPRVGKPQTMAEGFAFQVHKDKQQVQQRRRQTGGGAVCIGPRLLAHIEECT